jgi:hypothetical protein
MGPGAIGQTKSKSSKKEIIKSVYGKRCALYTIHRQINFQFYNFKEKRVTKDIWNVDEVEEGAEYDNSDDSRPQPEYEIIYKQDLTSEELFLGMSNKTPATSSCEYMIVKIQLPGTKKISEIDVNVFDKFLDCRTVHL